MGGVNSLRRNSDRCMIIMRAQEQLESAREKILPCDNIAQTGGLPKHQAAWTVQRKLESKRERGLALLCSPEAALVNRSMDGIGRGDAGTLKVETRREKGLCSRKLF